MVTPGRILNVLIMRVSSLRHRFYDGVIKQYKHHAYPLELDKKDLLK
jgi:hypothetical protein